MAGEDPERTASLRQPAIAEVGPAWVEGRPSRRLMVVLRAPGCSYALRTGGCTICGFTEHLSTRGRPVSAEQLCAQLDAAIESHRDERSRIEHLDLYCSGSFFNDEEIPPGARVELARLAARRLPALRTLLLDSRPEFITGPALAELLAVLAPGERTIGLEIAIGLESADDEIRNRKIRKGFSLASFERAAEAIAGAGASLAVYLLLKPPGVDEEAAIADVIQSGSYLAELGSRIGLGGRPEPSEPGARPPGSRLRVALEPTLVILGTALHAEHLAGRYRSPSLASVVRATLGLAGLGLQVHVGLSDEGLPTADRPRGCPACDAPLRELLRRFNRSQDGAELRAFRCDCGSG
jgi:uncharacterized Fe-S cluster-containing MiaB family protein